MFLICGAILLVHRLFGSILVAIVLSPIQQIFNAIREFKEGSEELLPQIVLKEEGEFAKLASIFNALTCRIQKQVENLTKQREETKEILESLEEGIIALDPSAKVTFANQTARKLLKLIENCQSLNDAQAFELGIKCQELILHALQTSEQISHKFTLESKYLELIAAPLAYRDGALLVIQDKTSDYKVIEMGKNFVANASHELKTPITIIRGFAETLQDMPKLSKQMQKQIIEKIVRTCGRLDKLVRSLLTLADVENVSQERFKLADLIPLVENCAHLVLSANPLVQINLNTELKTAPIIADADLMELAIMNILENGIKYSALPAKIEIGIEKKGEEVQISLKDQGIGIPESDLERIFDRFYTVDKARSRKSGGAGLGLSIVKTIVEKHHGKVYAISKLGLGSTFTFVLPSSFCAR